MPPSESVTIGQVLLINKIITQTELMDALEQQKREPNRKLGEILVESGKVTQATLLACLQKQVTFREQGASKVDVHAAIDFAEHDTGKVSSEIEGMIEELEKMR